jgi:DNA polymerase III epsilon subunit-like protein
MNKDNLIFLDVETTGRGLEDRLCQVAYKFKGRLKGSLFKPPLPISIEAMAVSHITNEMVADKSMFLGSPMYEELKKIFSSNNILVAHNAGFDAEMLKKENLKIPSVIDTYKIAQALDEKAEISKYSLQYLRYYFNLDLDIKTAPAHNAFGDVKILEKLFEVFLKKISEKTENEEKTLEKMLEISFLPVLVKKFNFGKYKGMFVKEIVLRDPGYLQWLLEEKTKMREREGINDENWIYTLEYYLK